MEKQSKATRVFTKALGMVETGVYAAVGVLLSVAAVTVLGYTVWDFWHSMGHDFMEALIRLFENLLLTLMAVEILYTVIVSIDTRTLLPEPFLVVGLLAAIRRILTLSVEGAKLMSSNPEHFILVLWEIGLLAFLILILVASIVMLRKSGGGRVRRPNPDAEA